MRVYCIMHAARHLLGALPCVRRMVQWRTWAGAERTQGAQAREARASATTASRVWAALAVGAGMQRGTARTGAGTRRTAGAGTVCLSAWRTGC